MRLERNLLLGLANSGWSAILGLAVVPLYLKYLGIEAYGLIGFFATAQALSQLLDMGMAPTINREVARCTVSGCMRDARNLLHTLAIINWGISVIIALLIFALAPLISKHWLQSNYLTIDTVSNAVVLMGVVVAARWPVGLYQGVLMGAQRLAVSSGINILVMTIGGLGAIGILAFISPTIEAFFIWQALVGFIYAGVMRLAAWRVLGVEKYRKFDLATLNRVWRFSAGMSLIALLGIILSQLDKIILSKLLGLEEFGKYMLATVVASSLYAMAAPFFNVVYPRFSALVVAGNTAQLEESYCLSASFLAIVLFPLAMFLALFAEDLLVVWTGNTEIAESVAPIVNLLVIGTAIHCVMYIPYALQLAYGNTRLPFVITLTLIILLVPLLVLLTLTAGAQGAAMAWLALHMAYLIIGTWATHRQLLKGLGQSWILREVGIPFFATAIVGLAGSVYIKEVGYSLFGRLFFGVLLVLVAATLAIVFSSRIRIFLVNRFTRHSSGT